jgi:hypothetical protein
MELWGWPVRYRGALMNYPYPIPGMQGNTAAFIAGVASRLGSYNKPLDARSLVSVDYSQLIPTVTLVGYSFKVRPGGEPQLWINSPAIDTTDTLLTFYVEGGIGGRAYEIIINTTLADTEIRTDVLTVNVQGDDCACAALMTPTYPPGYSGAVSSDGSVIVNTALRFFVSATTPIGAHVLDRWYNTTTGNIYDYVSNGLTSWWEEATIGGGGGYGANIVKMNPITPDGSTVEFTLTATDGTAVDIQTSNNLLVSVDGVWQEPTAQYAASVNVVEFAQAPTADSMIFMLWLSPPSDTPPAPGP